jgi:transposase
MTGIPASRRWASANTGDVRVGVVSGQRQVRLMSAIPLRRVLREQIVILHRRLLAIVRDDEACRCLMTIPGVGPVVALTYRATVDVRTGDRGLGASVGTSALRCLLRATIFDC